MFYGKSLNKAKSCDSYMNYMMGIMKVTLWGTNHNFKKKLQVGYDLTPMIIIKVVTYVKCIQINPLQVPIYILFNFWDPLGIGESI